MTAFDRLLQFLRRRYERLESLLEQAETAAYEAQTSVALARLESLRTGLEPQFALEADVLFPEFERLGAGDCRLTAALASEQAHLLFRLERCRRDLLDAASKPVELLEEFDVLLDAHRAKQEIFLYPTLVRLSGDELADELADALAARLARPRLAS